MILFFVTWLRRFFAVDESRLRIRLYLHDGLDIDRAVAFWAARPAIPVAQFTKPYRAVPDLSSGGAKHVMGCPAVVYVQSHPSPCAGLVAALLSTGLPSGVAQLAERRPVKPFVVGSSPTPGATLARRRTGRDASGQ